MKILFLTVGDETVASSRVRVYGYIPVLAKNGHRCRVLQYTSKSGCKRISNLKSDNILQRALEIFHKLCTITSLFFLAPLYNVIFVQKIVLSLPVWRLLKSINRNIIFDFDDAVYLDKEIGYILKSALCIVVSNGHLKNIASRYNDRVYELISPVEPTEKDTSEKSKYTILGWLGSPGTSTYLHRLIPVFKSLREEFRDLKIELMGAKDDAAFCALGVTVRRWSLKDEKEFLKTLDIGIMPLDEDELCRAKGGYKLLLYMANSIPCVASPVGINSMLISEGVNGFLPSTQNEWFEKLSLLIRDSSLRRRIGEQGRKMAEGLYSYKTAYQKLTAIFNSVGEGRKC